ncbi:DUF6350 family protein [Mycetocola zhadangensis]|uniref:Uncharacterized protein n=1 Tax=Mycetocola zhadangensis TaxID=1164595 RepID=A0A3L7J460_9MICO|nr:DUF6350 family protein [Mycetocola zhadangensis]RLQ85468.1 hypothetical protein D9V28_00820 [Mycetocola zhadangensis]GGE82874.1 hypothetical protein GCM10011313_01620 [Mycetocola zhadangensis]
MNRTTLALLAALEALITVAIGIAVTLVPLSVLWATDYGFSVDWLVFWRAAVDIWLLGNGVNLTVALPGAIVAAIGIPEAATPFVVSIAPLAVAGFTVFMGARTGARAAGTRLWPTGVVAALVTFILLTGALALTAQDSAVRPSLWQSFLIPGIVYALGLAIGALRVLWRADAAGQVGDRGLVSRVTDRFDDTALAVMGASLRGGLAVVLALIAVAATLLAVLIVGNFGVITSLYQSSQLGVSGGIMATIAQIGFLGNFVIWVAAWLIGPGFALGAGSSISPVNTLVGPVPALPLLGAVPSGDLPLGFLGLLVPLAVGFLAAALVRPRLVSDLRGGPLASRLALAAVGIGVVSAIVLGLLAWFSGGAVGPGRLVSVGPNPLMIALFAFVEVTLAALIGMASGKSDTAQLDVPSGRSASRVG